MPFLKRANGEQTGQCIEIKGDEFLIGRAPDCDLVLDPQGVSRHHARIYRGENRFYIEDLRSRNKTRVNDEEIQPGQDHLFRPGDRLNICDVEFVFLTRMPPPTGPNEEVIVTDRLDESTIHTVDASTVGSGSAVPAGVKLQAILEITRKLSSALEIDAVAPKVLDSLFELFPQSERAFLVLKDRRTGRLVRKAFKHRPPRSSSRGPSAPLLGGPPRDDEVPMSISRTIVNHVLDNKKAVLSSDAGNDQDLPTSASIADLKIRSVMCAPLLAPDGQALGILQLDTTASKQFRQDDLDLLVAVASQSAISIQNAQMHEDMLVQERVKRDLKLAEQVQRWFLPRSVPKVEGYQFFAYYHAAHSVGGDFYDFVPLHSNRLAIALADVSGKGVAAALMAAKFSGDTRYCILTEDAPAPAADALNQLLCDAGIEEKFITMSLGVLEFATGRLTLCSAGHLEVLVRRADGRVEAFGEAIGGLPLGVMPDVHYDQTVVELNSGDVVVVYSDGVYDARSPRGDLYHTPDHPRLDRRVAESVGNAETVGRSILQDVREFSAGQAQADDITLICFSKD